MRKVPPFQLLDVARGWAALSVAIFHSTMTFLAWNPDYIRQPYYAITSVGCLGVILFFLISGYCIMGTAYHALLSGQKVRRYAWNRLTRIYPPYLATCVLAIGVEVAVVLARRWGYEPPPNYYAPPHPESTLFWASNFLLLQAELHQFCLVMVFWTLSYEIGFYAVIGIFLFATQNRPRSSTTPAVVLLFSANTITTFFSLLWVIVSPDTCPFPFDLWYQFGLGAMMFGLVAARFRSEAQVPQALASARSQILIAIILTAALTINQFMPYWRSHLAPRLDGIACLGFLGLATILYPYDRKLALSPFMQPFVWLGTFSYSMYLTHTIGLPFITTGMRNLGFDHGWYWVTSFVQIAASILGGWIFYLLVERHFISKHQKEITA